MQLLLAVTLDLYSFAYDSIRSLFAPRTRPRVVREPIELPAPREPRALLGYPPMPFAAYQEDLPEPAFAPDTPRTSSVRPVRNTVMYTASIATPIKSAPAASGDATIAVLPYGSMVMVLKTDDVWAYVASGTHEGWVYAEDLEDRAAHVYPAFHIGEENQDDDPATLRLRAIIEDEFGAGEIGLPLQAEEYVLYRLIRRGVKVPWPKVRPRSPGMWASILKDVPQVRLSGEPASGSIMEFTHSEEGREPWGHLAYVEAVFPDGSVQLSEANWPEQGIYNERVLVLSEWRALNPTFLHV